MKKLIVVLSALVAFPLLAGGALWLYGMRGDTGRNGASIEIARPPQVVWPYVTRFEQIKKWNAGLEQITPSDAPLTVGARATVLARGRPEEEPLSLQQELTYVEAPKRLAFTLSTRQQGMGFDQRVEYRLEERNGGTRVSFVGEATYFGFIRLLEPVVTAVAQAKLEKDLLALKKIVEQETQAAPAEPAPIADAPAAAEDVQPAAQLVPSEPHAAPPAAEGVQPAAETSPAPEAAPPAPADDAQPQPPAEEPAMAGGGAAAQ